MNYNSFCIFCVGKHCSNLSNEIEHCEFRDCPFYDDRFADVTHEDNIEIAKKLLGDMGITK